MTGILETAVRSSNAQYDAQEILNRLDVRLLEIQQGDLGWDVFTLDYHVDAPINTVFSSNAMGEYLLIFNFLWRLKRVEYTLSASWKKWSKASREFASLSNLQQDLQVAQLAIQRMIHFIYQLQHYVLFEVSQSLFLKLKWKTDILFKVLECSWDKLETFIEHESVDLDSIIAAHTKYLSEITEKGFLSGEKESALAGRLGSIFDCILKYKVNLDILHDHATSAIAKNLYGGTTNARELNAIQKQLEENENSFTMQALQFLDQLNEFHDEDLRSLSTRLDYNDFYSNFERTSLQE